MTTQHPTAAWLALAAAFALLAAAAPAVAGTEFLTYEGRDAIQDGRGGNKTIAGGVEFWLNGTPPHRYQVLGMLVDERWESGLWGTLRMANLRADIARRAHAAGGDAVILQEQHDHVRGVAQSSFGSSLWAGHSLIHLGTSRASPYGTKASRFVVVKYLPDQADTAGATSPPHMPAPSLSSSAEAPPPTP